MGIWCALARSRYQVCGQDGPGYRHARSTCIYRSDATDVHGISWRVGFNFGKCGFFCPRWRGCTSVKGSHVRGCLFLVLCRHVPHHRRSTLKPFFTLGAVIRAHDAIYRPISSACIAYLGHCERITLFRFARSSPSWPLTRPFR